MKISIDQKNLIKKIAIGDSIILTGKAGTGKTFTGILCGIELLKKLKPWQKILYLTYSKLAKNQLNSTIKKIALELEPKHIFKNRMAVYNYHSLWWQLISNNTGFLDIKSSPIICTRNEINSMSDDMLNSLYEKKQIPAEYLRKSDRKIDQTKKNNLLKLLNGYGIVFNKWGLNEFGREGGKYKDNKDFFSVVKNEIVKRNRMGYFYYPELVWWAYYLLEKHPNIKNLFIEKYPILIIDEFQDTDISQWDVVKLISPKTVMVMADSAQTIHYWRGADPKRLEQFNEFRTNKMAASVYIQELTENHRAGKNMALETNINFVKINISEKTKENIPEIAYTKVLKKNTQYKIMGICKQSNKNGENVGILCLTNDLANDVFEFVRKQNMYIRRLGSDNSPYEAARELLLELLIRVSKSNEVHNYIANDVASQLIGIHDRCTAKSKKEEKKERWRHAEKMKGVFTKNFGQGIAEIGSFISNLENRHKIKGDRECLNCIKYVANKIIKGGNKNWENRNIEEKRTKIDNLILQYENATNINSGNSYRSIMTIHQVKGKEFDTVIIPWFTKIPWTSSNPLVWCDKDEEIKNLFHTACTRARRNVFVLYPEKNRAVIKI